MKEEFTPSLLPYLQSNENHIRLEISLTSRKASYLEKSPFPFLMIDESTPFERLMEARIITVDGSTIKRVFVLQQSDNYRHVADEMWPLNNKHIDQHWRNTIEAYFTQSESGNSNPILLPEQVKENGNCSPFQSLFYCAHKDVYFHPPCPQCGDLLQLCCDDTLLIESNLIPYTTSVKRYLYCPKCQQETGDVQFYAYSREGNDPPTLRDRRDLVDDFGKLILRSESIDWFPCMNCPELTACYGTDNRVMSRIVPYSFYPFHLLIFDANSMSAPDFLALVSGASLEALKSNLSVKQAHGRLRCLQAYERRHPPHSSFMFGSDSDKSFLEILYLKISFLGELIRKFFSNSSGDAYCEASLSLDRVWVSVADQAGLLPQFWNFNLSILDIWLDLGRRPHLSKYPPTYGHHFLGAIWFYTLLANDRQSFEEVRAELDRHKSVFSAQDSVFSKNIPTAGAGAVFSPENVFWNPAANHVQESWHRLWNKSLDIGGALLTGAFRSENTWSLDNFWLDYNSLRAEIKTALFGPAPAAEPAGIPSDDSAIADILIRLHRQLRRQLRPAANPLTEKYTQKDSVAEPQETGSPAETLILSPDAQMKSPISPNRGLMEEETLILPPQSRFQSPTPDPASTDEDLIQETVILRPGDTAPASAGPDPTNAGLSQDDIPETVVLSPGGHSGGRDSLSTRTSLPDNQNDLNKPPAGDPPLPQAGVDQNADTPQDDDFLTETVILRPDKRKGPQNE
jgi:hypothetical protein